MDIKTLRKNTGLSQQDFSEKYSIPLRTIQDWEAGKRTPTKYVTDMLTYIVADESVTHKAWVFYEYAGCDRDYMLFKSKAEAISYAKDNWDHMNRHDQLGYINDSAGEFWVAELPVEWDDDLEKFEPDFSEYTPVWDAIKEYKEKNEK